MSYLSSHWRPSLSLVLEYSADGSIKQRGAKDVRKFCESYLVLGYRPASGSYIRALACFLAYDPQSVL